MLSFIPKNNCTVVIHTLRHIFGNPNRGEDCAPKTVTVGDVQRAHISYQSYNAALREKLRELLPAPMFGKRTSKITDLIMEAGKDMLPTEELAAVANSIGIGLRGKEESESKDTSKTQVMLFGDQEIKALLGEIVKLKAENPKVYASLCDPMSAVTSKLLTAIEDSSLSAEVKTLLTERVASVLNQKKLQAVPLLKEVTIPANLAGCTTEEVSVWVKGLEDFLAATEDSNGVAETNKWLGKGKAKSISHVEIRDIMKGIKVSAPMPLEKQLLGAFSTSKDTFPAVQSALYTMGSVGVTEFASSADFFSCMDDVTGIAAHINRDRVIHSSLGYEYACLNMRDYLNNNGNNKEEAAAVIEAIVYAIMNLRFIGGRKQGGNQIPPIFMFVEVIPSTNAYNYISAFTKPIKGDTVDYDAVNALLSHANPLLLSRNIGKTYAWFTNKDFKPLMGEKVSVSWDQEGFCGHVKDAIVAALEKMETK